MQLFSLLDWIDLCYSHGYLSDLSSAFKPRLGPLTWPWSRQVEYGRLPFVIFFFPIFSLSLFNCALAPWGPWWRGRRQRGSQTPWLISLGWWSWRWCGGPSSSWLSMLVMLLVHHLRWIELRRHDCGKPFCFCCYSYCLGEKLLLLQSGFVRGDEEERQSLLLSSSESLPFKGLASGHLSGLFQSWYPTKVRRLRWPL